MIKQQNLNSPDPTTKNQENQEDAEKSYQKVATYVA